MERLAAIFKALSDRNRLAIFQTIRSCCCDCGVVNDSESPGDAGNSVSDIAGHFNLSLSTVSHHLKELRNAGLIICEKRGQWVHCRPNPEVLKDIEGFLDDVES